MAFEANHRRKYVQVIKTVWLSLHGRMDKARPSAKTSVVLGLLIAAGCGSSAFPDDQFPWRDIGGEHLVLKRMGSFMVGGTVVTTPGEFNPMNPTPAGQTLSGDHTYVQFEIPQDANRNGMLMWGSLVKTPWETTPDGRDGFEQTFLRQNWSVYLADRPRMGEAARTTVGTTITPTAGEQGFFIQFRLGLCSAGSPPVQCNLYPGSKFPPGPAALDQFNRWLTQSVGPGDATLTLNDLLAIVNKSVRRYSSRIRPVPFQDTRPLCKIRT